LLHSFDSVDGSARGFEGVRDMPRIRKGWLIRSWAIIVTLTCLPFAIHAQNRPLREVVDAEVEAAWKREKVKAAAPAADAEFLRRVSLDLTGVVPSFEEAAAFLDSKDSDKRAKLIDQLLADPRF